MLISSFKATKPFFFPFAMPNFMQTFVDNNYIVCYQSVQNKSTLRWGYKLMENLFQFIGNDLVTNMYITLQGLICLYSVTFLDLVALGIKTIYV